VWLSSCKDGVLVIGEVRERERERERRLRREGGLGGGFK